MASDRALISVAKNGPVSLPSSRNQFSAFKQGPGSGGANAHHVEIYAVDDFLFTHAMDDLYSFSQKITKNTVTRKEDPKNLVKDYTNTVANDTVSHQHKASCNWAGICSIYFEGFLRFAEDPTKGGVTYKMHNFLQDGSPVPSNQKNHHVSISERKLLDSSTMQKKSGGGTTLDDEYNGSKKLYRHASHNLPSCKSQTLQNDSVYPIRCPNYNCQFMSSYVPLIRRFNNGWGPDSIACARCNRPTWGNRCTGKFYNYPVCAMAQGDPFWAPSCCLNSIGWGMNHANNMPSSSTLTQYKKNSHNVNRQIDANPFQRNVVCDSAHPPVLQQKEQTACYLLLPSKKVCAANVNVSIPALLKNNHPCFCNWYKPLYKYLSGQLSPTSAIKTQLAALSKTALNFCEQTKNQGNNCCKCLSHRPGSCGGGKPCILYTTIGKNIHPVQPINSDNNTTLSLTDYVCVYPPCAVSGQREQLTTMSMERRKQTCPANVCYQIMTHYTLHARDVCGGQGIYLGNVNSFCSGSKKCQPAACPSLHADIPDREVILDPTFTPQYEVEFSFHNNGDPQSLLCPRIKSIHTKCPPNAKCYNSDECPDWLDPQALDSYTIQGGDKRPWSVSLRGREMAEGKYTVKFVIHDPYHTSGATVQRTLQLNVWVTIGKGPAPPSPGGKIPPHHGGAHVVYKHKIRTFYKYYAIILVGLAALVFVAAILFYRKRKENLQKWQKDLEKEKEAAEKVAQKYGVQFPRSLHHSANEKSKKSSSQQNEESSGGKINASLLK
jgi:hypothetical protein